MMEKYEKCKKINVDKSCGTKYVRYSSEDCPGIHGRIFWIFTGGNNGCDKSSKVALKSHDYKQARIWRDSVSMLKKILAGSLKQPRLEARPACVTDPSIYL